MLLHGPCCKVGRAEVPQPRIASLKSNRLPPAWFREGEKEHWGSPADVKRKYRHASIVGDRVVFNIKGDNYRLVIRINYELEVVYVRFVGTHEEYDEIDVREV